ncbi:cytochrome P450 [Nocardia niigatensis]
MEGIASERDARTVRLPFDQTDPLRLPDPLRELQAQAEIHRVRTAHGDAAWLVTGYAAVRALLGDARLGRSHPAPDAAARVSESALLGGPVGNFATEHADHHRVRSLLLPHFSPRRMREFRPRVEALATHRFDDLLDQGSPADLHATIAVPLPLLVICELLDIPETDRDRFREWTVAAADVRDEATSAHGMSELYRYGLELTRRRRAHPGTDIISQLCAVDGVPDEEIAGLVMVLLFTGHETTVAQIGYAIWALLSNPGQLRLLREHPGLIPNAVEETLRIPARGGHGLPRYARTDIEFGGVEIRRGDLVLFDVGAANHEPAVYPDPERVDITRAEARTHLGFGHGAYYCIGAPLARLELEVIIQQLVTRFPTMRPAIESGTIRIRSDALAGGLVALPVRWES